MNLNFLKLGADSSLVQTKLTPFLPEHKLLPLKSHYANVKGNVQEGVESSFILFETELLFCIPFVCVPLKSK